MRSRFLLVLALLLLIPAVLYGQRAKGGQVPPDSRSPEVRAEAVFKELAKTTYTARRDLPASENIFIENGRVMEELLIYTMREHPVAVAAGKPSRVSKVVLMDTAIQVLFQERCGFVIVTPGDREVRMMTVPQVLDVVRQGLNSVFQVSGAEAKPKLPT